MKNKRRIIGILVALILALVGTISLVGYVRSAKDRAVAEEANVDLYVVEKFVPKGAEAATIKSSVSIEQVPSRLKQDGAITDLEAVGDKVAAADLQPGDQLVAARLAPKELVTKEVTDKVQISALLEAERAVGGAIKKGDLVAIYLSFDPFEVDEAGQDPDTAADVRAAAGTADDGTADDGTADDGTADDGTADASAGDDAAAERKRTPNVTGLEFQHVLVTNVQTVSAPVSPDGEEDAGIAQVTGTQYVVTLALSPEQSERFVFATEFGHVWLSIDPAALADDGTRPVTLANVFTVVK